MQKSSVQEPVARQSCTSITMKMKQSMLLSNQEAKAVARDSTSNQDRQTMVFFDTINYFGTYAGK
jgi:hypothetical protein